MLPSSTATRSSAPETWELMPTTRTGSTVPVAAMKRAARPSSATAT
jgi:hypothetical protein